MEFCPKFKRIKFINLEVNLKSFWVVISDMEYPYRTGNLILKENFSFDL